MYSTLLGDATFHNLLLACDRDIANQVRRRRCLLCRSSLHSANYPRKARGRLCRLPPEHDWRLSLCCARHGCRKRKTPPSLRFLGRKVYLAMTIVVMAILREGATQARLRRLAELIRIDRRTIERWRRWWARASRQCRSGKQRVPRSCRRSMRPAYQRRYWSGLQGSRLSV